MKSSSGKYFVGLDHIRATAAFMVFAWHFIHIKGGHLSPPPFLPLSFLTEGHTGVALFMTLSGYLFAKLLDGKNIMYGAFLWNRFIRLGPLLFAVIIIRFLQVASDGDALCQLVRSVALGFVKPSLPNGGWSVTCEVHFYLLLPLILRVSKRNNLILVAMLLFAVLVRACIYCEMGEVESYAYWTICGRIDQFLMGIIAYRYHIFATMKPVHIGIITTLFAVYYWIFDWLGGLFTMPSYPSPSPLWIIMPTIEGIAYGSIIAFYDNLRSTAKGPVSRCWALVGTCSYSIYLVHFFFVSMVASFIDEHICSLANIYVALAVSVVGFALMIPIGVASHFAIEKPFMRFRVNYLRAH